MTTRKTKTKTTADKTQTNESPVTEEIQTESSSDTTDVVVPKRYYVEFWKNLQPYAPQFDQVVGTIYWSDVQQKIIIASLAPNCDADIRNIMLGDISIGNGLSVSLREDPKGWLLNLHKANFSKHYYCKQYMETLDEIE